MQIEMKVYNNCPDCDWLFEFEFNSVSHFQREKSIERKSIIVLSFSIMLVMKHITLAPDRFEVTAVTSFADKNTILR